VDPTALTFVQQLAWTMADQGEKVSVICPVGINRNKKYKKLPEHTTELSFSGEKIDLFFPKFIDCGQTNVLFFNTACITTFLFMHSVDRVIDSMVSKPDVLYGHFITPSGVTASQLGNKYSIPAFAAYGESTPWTIFQLGINRTKRYLDGINGIVSVSSANKEELASTGVVPANKIEVFPNGYRTARFYKVDKVEARKHFNIPQNKFVVGFVGHFIERKGINLLVKAIDLCDDVYGIFAGKGPLKPSGERVLLAEQVNPDELAYFYSAADVFVLPTQNEGCCNAIIEAMACGLPIISSNLPFNDDILDETNSLKIDPTNIEDIVKAIETIKKDDELKKVLAEGSVKKAESLTLETRAKNILYYMKGHL
jgi:glycosyltransferase involved in cell wall biosynthesis